MRLFDGKLHRSETVAQPRKTAEENTSDVKKKHPNEYKIRYRRLNTGRRVFIEQLRLILVWVVTGCVLLSIETTPPGMIHLPGLGDAAPSLGLLFTMAVGFLWREEEGAIVGLLCGWLADATGAAGMMLSPLLYFLCGYLAGNIGRRRLAHNMPSFVVFAVLGGGLEAVFTLLREIVRIRSLPPLFWTMRGVIPVWMLTVILSPVVYGILYAERKWLGDGS